MNAAQTVQRNVAIVVLTVLVSTALAAWAAFAMAQRDQERSARTIAEQVLARNERITTQVYEALREVNSEAHGAPCAAQALAQMTRTALRASLLQAVVYIEGNTIGHSMKKKLIAEGIETQLQHDYVATRNVHVGQGWLYAKAMGPSHIAVRLEKQLRQAQGRPA